jgi:flagellar biosynthesis GTPase FlhF
VSRDLSAPVERNARLYRLAIVGLSVGAGLIFSATLLLVYAAAARDRNADSTIVQALASSDAAKAEAAKAAEKIAALGKQAADTQLVAEQERVLRVKMERALQEAKRVRQLNVDQAERLISSLKKLAPALTKKVSIGASDDAEAFIYAGQIATILQRAGIELVGPVRITSQKIVFDQDIGIAVKDLQKPPPSALSLNDALQSSGLTTFAEELPQMAAGETQLLIAARK